MPSYRHTYCLLWESEHYPDRNHQHNVDGMLLYAKTKSDDLDDKVITHRDGYTIFIRTLNLNTEFSEIQHRLESFV